MYPLNKYITETVHELLHERFEDIVNVGVKLRIKISQPEDPSVKDVLTGIRGIKHVITVRQTGILTRPDSGKQFIYLIVGYEMHADPTLETLAKQIKNIAGVDMTKILSYDGKEHLVGGKPIVV